MALIYIDPRGKEQKYTFRSLRNFSNQLANTLKANGIKPADRVGILLSQRPETLISHIAIYKLGEIAVKSPDPVMFLEYWKNPRATREKFINDWMRTGDYGRKDKDGNFWFSGRQDDIIESGGFRIGPVPEVPGFYVNCGYWAGVMLSPEAGKRISQLVSGHLAPEDNPLRPTRFKEGLGKKGKTLMSH